MRVAVPCITPTSFYINALFIQPTTYCRRNCPNCYVKGFEETKPEPEKFLIEEFLGFLIRNLKSNDSAVDFNQITFALDALAEKTTLKEDMVYPFRDYIGLVNLQIPDQEYHLTVHTIEDFFEYERILSQSLRTSFDVISISSLERSNKTSIDKIRSYSKHINFNFMPRNRNPRLVLDHLETVAPWVDSIYLLLEKPSTGELISPRILESFFKTKTLLETSAVVKSKLIQDGCVSDSKKFLNTGFGCSSNKSRFQVWPNGAVSGCPYSHFPETGSATSTEEILKNIYDSSRQYSFNKCKIPEQIDPKNPKVLKNYLEILD